MFHQEGRGFAPAFLYHHYIMTHSVKRFPAGPCCCCKSRKRGKKVASRRFRRDARVKIASGRYEQLHLKSIELTCSWDLGGDGKCFYGWNFARSTDRWKRK